MSKSFVSSVHLPSFPLWKRMEEKRIPASFSLEVTARCNNDCCHCYINLPAGDREARARELSVEEIKGIAGQAASLGALWCLITGGEPLLREDFCDLYLVLKRQGLLPSVFTNACLLTREHVKLFKEYPPRNLEVTVYGATPETYERVTRRPESFAAFRRGLELLLSSGVKVSLKAMAMRANAHELPQLARFCRRRTRDFFRFDPQLHLRYDGNAARNEEIRAQRLSPQEIVALEQADPERSRVLKKECDQLIAPSSHHFTGDHLFHCGAGHTSFTVGYDGLFRLCDSLWHSDCVYDLRRGSLRDAWYHLVPRVLEMRSQDREFFKNCGACPIIDLCLWCPAHAHLETGRLDAWVKYFCRVAHARAAALGYEIKA